MIVTIACIFAQFFKTWTPEEKEARAWIAKYEQKQSLLGHRLIASGLRKQEQGLLLYLDWQLDHAAPAQEEAKKLFREMVMEMKESLGHDRLEVSVGWASGSFDESCKKEKQLIQLRFVSGMIESIEESFYSPHEREIHLSKEVF